MKRSAFTLVELLIVVAIVGVLLMLIVPLVGGIRGCTGGYYSKEETANYRCVKTYTVQVGEDTSSKRVDLEPENGGAIITMACDDDFAAGISNSATLYAQFEADRWYRVHSIGYRQEGWYALFPVVKSVTKIANPKQTLWEPSLNGNGFSPVHDSERKMKVRAEAQDKDFGR